MADSDDNRIVYPDEVEDAKEAAAKAVDNEAGDSNSIEEQPPETISTRNMIVVPPNCPPGQQMGVDGVCRPVWK